MKQKIYKVSRLIVVLTLTLLVLSSCKKWLELEPSGEIIQENFWKTEAEVNGIVAGCYKSMCEDAYMERIILWGEGRSDNVITTYNDDEFERMVNMDLTPTSSYCTWGPFYVVINRCNTFLDKAKAVMDLDPNFTMGDYNQLRSEVLAIRAMNYFYLVRAFRNVPWKETATLNDNENLDITQSSDTFVIAKVISDLKEALMYAPTEFVKPDYNKGRITKYAVMAILADVYLWNQQYDECVQMCNQIINSKKYTLPDYDELLDQFFSGNSTESIFELQFGDNSGQEAVNSIVRLYYWKGQRFEFAKYLVPGNSSSPFNYTGSPVAESVEDYRFKEFVDNAPAAGSSSYSYGIFKYIGSQMFEDINGKRSYLYPNSYYPNWVMYRLADIILMKAEALVQLNRNQNDLMEAMDMVNTTYLRSNPDINGDSLKFQNYSNPIDLNKLILRERQRELLFEGKRYYDLMRFAIRANSPAELVNFISTKRTNSTTQIGPQSLIDAIYLPVNTGVLHRSPSLKQNPYYETSNDGTVAN